jgi:di/tricarboxylate transporter
MFIPVVIDWCRRNEISPSKVLIPLSFLTILGGTCTLIGTSTNLVVHGLMLEDGLRGIGLFELTKVGAPYAVIGFLYLVFFSRWLLPERKELLEQLGESRREYLVEMQVQPQSPLVGQTIEVAGLRHLPGLFLIEIDRDGEIIGPVRPDEVLSANDRLVFTGVVSSIIGLEKIPGLVPASDPAYQVAPRQQRRRRLCEAVISASSPLIGQTIRETDFRASYGAAVVAVHRSGARVEKKVGDIRLRPGDTLLLQTGPHFLRAHRNDPAFYLVSDVEEWRPLRYDRAWIAVTLFLVLLVLITGGWADTLTASALIAVLMVAAGCLSAGEARNSIEWQVLITIAASFGVGTALERSGAAGAMAGAIFDATQAWGPVAALICVYLVTSILTELVTNNAAAVLVYPFCLQTATLYNVDERPFLMALVLAASASFVTPIGYQTNLMVYGPGGYRFLDFVRIGAPLKLVLTIVAVVLIPLFWPF